jgi:LPS-assembly protein
VISFERMRRIVLLSMIASAAAAPSARAQNAPGGCTKMWEISSGDVQQVNGANHTVLLRNVQINCNDIQLFADQVELISDADRLRATGNVVFVSTGNRISADRLDFNTRTKTGTFYVASGIANLEARGVDRSFFGTQEPDAFFWGETIEKLGPRTYKITHGGFTTCAQPTPRWQLVATSVVLTLEKHATLKNALMKVKDVPVFYIPAMYYPINKEDRATGLLIPVYGASSVKGQTISNAFFWAINRSQDATFYNSFYSKTGYSFGSQYRYVQTRGSGNVQFTTVREHEASYDQPDGSVNVVPGIDSYTFNGTLSQALPGNLRATAHADYFSSLVAQQRYQQNIYAATNRTRNFGGNIIGSWGANTISSTLEHDEIFTNATDSIVSGTLPRVNYTRSEQKLPDIPVYVGLTSEFVTLIRTSSTQPTDPTQPPQTINSGLSRIDVFPTIRFPFTKLPYLTFNSSLGFRETYWTGSNPDPTLPVPQECNPLCPQGVFRRYFTLQSDVTGPVFTKIFNTPDWAYAQKFKHVIEPVFSIQRTTNFDNYGQIVKLEGTDYTQGGVTSMTYGLNNRLYAKKQSSREILTVSLTQTYYSQASAGAYDTNYQGSSFTTDPTLIPQSNFSPVALTVHVSPTLVTDASMRMEYDAHVHALRSMSASGSITHGWVTGTAQWSLLHSTPVLITDTVMTTSHFINGGATVRKPGNGFGGTYNFNYDVLNTDFVSQSILGHYNTQCCGIIVEYQKFNYGTQSAAVIGVSRDHRFNISFTLAGIGTFSDLFGAFGGGLSGKTQ